MFFSPVFVDSASLRNGEHSQICGPHWIPSVSERIVLKNASDSNSEHFSTQAYGGPALSDRFSPLFPVAFLDFLCTDRQVSSRKRDRACWSSELYLGFVSTKEKLVCSYKTIHGEKVKSDQKTLCTCHRISGYAG